MKKRGHFGWLLSAMFAFLSVGGVCAQQTPQQSRPAGQPAEPAAPSTSDPSQSPASDVRNFTGTILKSGDRYIFQEAGTNKIYDLDRQKDMQQFEGKMVALRGVLDEKHKMIHVQ